MLPKKKKTLNKIKVLLFVDQKDQIHYPNKMKTLDLFLLYYS